MRKTYKFNHSIVQGGHVLAWKCDNIKNKEIIREKLNEIAEEFELIDATIRIYDSILFLFFMRKPTIALTEMLDRIVEKIGGLENWDKDYLQGTVYDLQEEYLKKYLAELGLDYDKG